MNDRTDAVAGNADQAFSCSLGGRLARWSFASVGGDKVIPFQRTWTPVVEGFGRSQNAFPSPPRRHRGMVLIVAIVLLTVATIIAASMLQSLAREHRQIRNHMRQLQAVWLTESAIERAVSELRQNSNYAGETWNVPADEMGDDLAASVEIKISQIEGIKGTRIVSVKADCSASSAHKIRHSKSVTVDLDRGG
jgi:Tfp pilus assembly protein PilX